MKKFFVTVTVISICVAAISGCGSKESATQNDAAILSANIGDTGGLKLPITDTKDVTITMMIESDFVNRTDSLVIKELSRRTGVNIKTIEVPSANLREKAKVLISSGQIPDILPGSSMNFREINEFGMQGGFAAINQFIHLLPNYKRIFVDDPENNKFFKAMIAGDGNLYYWPKYDVQRPVNHGFLYRKDIFDKHGIKPWSNTEEFYQALKQLKQIYPESIPLTSKTKSKIFADYRIGWGLQGDTTYYNEDEQIWKPIFTDPGYKDMLDFLKKLYAEKLLDAEFISDTQASWTSKMTQKEKAFVTFDWIGRLDMFREQVKSNIPEYNLSFGKPIGSKGTAIQFPKIESKGYGSVVANNKNTEISLKMLDYITSNSGTELLTLGVEGITYVKDSSGRITYPAFPPDKTIGIMDLSEKYGMFIEGTYTRMDKRSIYFNYSDKEKEAQDLIINNNLVEPIDPILSFSSTELETIKNLEIQLKNEADHFSTMYVINPSFGNEQWNEWVKKMESLGLDKMTSIYNEAQKRNDDI